MSKQFDPSKPVTTRTGTKVVIYDTDDPSEPNYPIAGRYVDINGVWRSAHWRKTGEFVIGDRQHHYDLVNTNETLGELHYINIYKRGILSAATPTRDYKLSVLNASNDPNLFARITLPATLEKGEGLTDEEKKRIGV